MSYADLYAQFIADLLPDAGLETFEAIETICTKTNWHNPQNPTDWHNLGVVTIVEAHNNLEINARNKQFYLAMNYFQKVINYPLSFLHYVNLVGLIGDKNNALLQSYNYLIRSLHLLSTKSNEINTGLIFLPQKFSWAINSLLSAPNGYTQFVILLGILFFATYSYSYLEPRWLHLSLSLLPEFMLPNLKWGLDCIHREKYEGLFYLHQAQKLEPHNPSTTQALYLAYKKLQNPIVAQYWLDLGRNFYLATDPQNPRWLWTTIGDRDDFTYIFFQESILLAVLPDLAQVVTIVLLADGDWFEGEMEFWNGYIQPGMTVIDVGANVGVYTFSAAREVGEEGKVIAIEPFAPCVTCLEETKRVNNLSQVVIKQAAASDRSGTLRLATFASSEFNAVTTDTDAPGMEVEAIALDDLIQTEGLTRVDVLKIDAEGHELAVLQGSEKLLDQFAPVIMYENISAKRSNTDVAIYLQERGYKLYYYRPFLCQMLPITDLQELEGKLNIIARKD